MRRTARNGTLILYPFSAGAFRQDIHSAIYRCLASNSIGTIISRDVQIRAGKISLFFAPNSVVEIWRRQFFFRQKHFSFRFCLFMSFISKIIIRAVLLKGLSVLFFSLKYGFQYTKAVSNIWSAISTYKPDKSHPDSRKHNGRSTIGCNTIKNVEECFWVWKIMKNKIDISQHERVKRWELPKIWNMMILREE